MSENRRPLLVLIDGTSYVFRAYHAMPPLTNAQGEPTGTIYGVANMLRGIHSEYAPDYAAVVFDAKGKTFRHDMYADYKANRPPMPDDLAQQLEPLYTVVRAQGWPFFSREGVEADDIIGSLAIDAAAAGMQVIISTADKDFAQLVNERIHLVNTMTGVRMDEAGVQEKFGVAPDQIIDYLTLVGDTSDNVPGVPGVGPKTAAKWLTHYGTLDQLIAHADAIKGKAGERLRDAIPQLALARDLVTIRTDLTETTEISQLTPAAADKDTLRELYTRFGFRRWLTELDEPASEQVAKTESGNDESEPLTATAAPEPVVSADYETILELPRLEAALNEARTAEVIAFDTETTSLQAMDAEIVGFSLAWKPGHAIYVPVAHHDPDCPDQIPREAALAALQPLLADPAVAKGGQNLKYDINVLANHKLSLNGLAFDTMLESYVLNSTGSRHDMDSLAQSYLGRTTIKYEEVAGKGAKQIGFDQVPVAAAAPYAAEDAEVTLALHRELAARLDAHPSLVAVYRDLELPLVPVLARIERNGVLVDASLLRTQSSELATRMSELEEQAYTAAGGRFNLASPKQLQVILFEQMQLPVLQKTPKGQPSTAESVLQELAHEYELPRLILEFRQLAKLKSTYTDRLPEQINRRTGRVHTSYHQAVAATGRLSSSDPNLQNIPVRSTEGRRIREAFIAPAGKRVVAADYSQIELRIMAHLSGDATLRRAFADEQDVHRATAAEVFGSAPDEVTSDQRRAAKAINFGLIYGMSAFGLARQLDIQRGEAQAYIERYFERYPGVKEFMDETRAKAREQGYVETLFGRRLYLPEINNRNQQRRQAAERTAINAPMQGTAADIIKRAMIEIDAWLAPESDTLMIMQVHDELVFEVPEADVDDICARVRTSMSGVAKLEVPLVVDIGVGNNWEEAH